jgi:hypothetical protein
MGAFVTGNNWYSGSTSDTGSIIYYSGTGTGGWYNSNIVFGQQAAIETILRDIYKEAKSFCEKSPHFDETLKGFSAIASRMLYKALIDGGYDSSKIRFGYIHNKHCSHVFVMLNQYDDYILDLCADQFGCDPLKKVKFVDTHPDTEPWWDTQITYESESGLIARQRKDGWPEHQITLKAAKTKPKPKFTLVTEGVSDISSLQLRVSPLDRDAAKYLEKLAKSDGLKTNLAALLLNSDSEVVDLALKLAAKLS